MKLKLSRRLVFRSLLVIFLLWALVLPFAFQKKANEKISDIPPPKSASNGTVQKTVKAESEPAVISRGMFKSINGQSGSGEVLLLKQGDKYYIRLEDNFTVSSGPDLFVALGRDGKVVHLVEKLKGNSGGQNFEVPADIDPLQHDQILIHCRAFQYSFAVADLVKPS